MSARSAAGITVVSASAGSGKTYRLTQVVTEAVDPRAASRVPLEGLVAVTYTKKAHAELAARIRQTLVSAGAFDQAADLPLSYLGTVHAACLRLLQEFALDAGLSPTVDVVAGDQGALLRQALDHCLPHDLRCRIDELASRWELRWNPKVSRFDWLQPVGDIMELARSNRIAPEALAGMAQRSVEGLLALLPPVPEKDGAALEDALAIELARAERALAKGNDTTGVTAGVKETIREARRRLADGELLWSHWAKLASLAPGAASRDAVAPLKEVAARYELHPRLRDEARELTSLIFEAARIGLSGYQAWKTERRVVDYVDMLDGALTLLDHPRVVEELASRLRLVVVDEFQDTSPIQLALFVKLHAISARSTWVGDRKQCIFEYAGADPTLMDAVAEWVAKGGGHRDTLGTNYRSRPELVKACSELFVQALAPHGFAREEVAVAAKRESPKTLAKLPAFGLWCLGTKNAGQDASAVADGVRRMLATPEATPVVDRTSREARDVRPGDIAVLVATNAEARAVAAALHDRGIRTAIARAGLLHTPEGALAEAAVRWLLDERDTLAAAVLDALTGFDGGDPDAWLEAKLAQAASATRDREPDAQGEATARPVWYEPLERVRERLDVLAPSEALDEALAGLDAVKLCARWPDPAQRVSNLDALRALTANYEDRARQEHEAATLAGLIRHFDDMQAETLRRDEMLASDDQHVPTDHGAVTVCTYHKSKGLEWPVVVLGSLGRDARRHPFDVCPETDAASFDPAAPLGGRWIRYWPWPLGATTKAPLRDAASQSAIGKRVLEREERERARLLYVGFTRARDHLVLAARVAKGKGQLDWLDVLTGADGDPLLALPLGAADGAEDTMRIGRGKGALAVPARVWQLSGEAEAAQATATEPRWFAAPPFEAAARGPAYGIAPSRAAEEWPELTLPRVGDVVKLPSSMPVEGKVAESDVLGDAVHRFFAADVEGLSPEHRLDIARRMVNAAALVGVVRPEALVEASDRLRAFVASRWPGASWRREVPVEMILTSPAERRVAGVIDLLLETEQGYLVLDHKTFPAASEAAWRKKTTEFLPQLAAYAEAVRRAGSKPVLGCWIHLPVGGGMVEAVFEGAG